MTAMSEIPEPEIVLIPEGEFIMGSEDGLDDEKPPHPVLLSAYHIGRYPVTNREYQAFVQDTLRSSPLHWEGSRYPEGMADHPVVLVSWRDVTAYCSWLSERTGRPCRLPTEAEWEKAASWDPTTGRKRQYPWGDKFDPTRCNSGEGGRGGTTPVGEYSPAGDSAYGCADMAGNVWEWCSTLYKAYPYDPQDGREDQEASGRRVLRGGAFSGSPRSVRCAARNWRGPGYHGLDYDGGFRVVAPG